MVKIHQAEKGRNAESAAESQVAMTQPAAPPVIMPEAEEIPNPNEYGNDKSANYPSSVNQQQPDLSAMTYEQNANGNIVAGKNVGVTPGTTLETPETQLGAQPEAQPVIPVEQSTSDLDRLKAQTATPAEPLQSEQVPAGQPVITQPAEEQPAAAVTPDGTPAYNPADYLVDWYATTPREAYNQGEYSIYDLIADHQKWANATGSPFKISDWFDLSKEQDINKTKEQNEQEAKKAADKEKFDQIGNFLSHLGNFIGTAGFGGLDIKPEDPVKFTERQRQLKEKAAALRNAYNKDFFDNYWKQQAADARQKSADATVLLKKIQGETDKQRADDNTRKTNEQIEASQQRTKQNEERTKSTIERNRVLNNATIKRAAGGGTRKGGGGNTKTERMYKEFDDNLANHPDLAEKFMTDNNIGGRSGKQWNTITMQRFNQYVKRQPKTTTARPKVIY